MLTLLNDNTAVSARLLHERLGIKTKFTDWWRRCCKYDFVDGIDYITQVTTTNGRPSADYILTLDTAKEICLLSNCELGKKYRRYLIKLEKDYTDGLLLKFEQKLEQRDKKIVELGYQIKKDACLCKQELYTVSEIGEELGLTARQLNNLLEQKGIQYKRDGVWYPLPPYDQFAQHTAYVYDTGCSSLLKWTKDGKHIILDVLKGV